MQDESFQIAQRTPKAGRWFLKSPEFQEHWRDGNLRKLWCHGIPGTGKTVLSSIVINHLQTRFSSNRKIACIYIYLDHRKHQCHSVTKLLCSVTVQLSYSTAQVSNNIREAHEVWKRTQQVPSERDCLKVLKSQAKGLERIFFVVDALDECLDDMKTNTLNNFLGFCGELPDNSHLMSTSRHVTNFAALIKPDCEFPITTDNSDIEAYFRKFIESRPQLNGLVEKGCRADPLFRDKALEAIIEKFNGMFLLADLYIQSLASTGSLAEFKSNLARLSASPDAVYATALERIKKQDKPQRKLAIKALNWLLHAERQLTVNELAHALAIPSETDDLRSNTWQLPSTSEVMGVEEALSSACVGIVAVISAANNGRIVGLIHDTAKVYLRNNLAVAFPNEDLMSTTLLTRTCLLYLMGMPSTTEDATQSVLDDIYQQYPLFSYAANFWGVHLDKSTKSAGDLYKLAWCFISEKRRLYAAVKAMADPHVSHEINVSGVHISAYFGLEKLAKKAIPNNKAVNLNAQTKRGETPLHWVITHGRRTFTEFLIREGAELNVPDVYKQTALQKAIIREDRHLIDIILRSHSLNLELKDSQGYTCLRQAAKYGQLPTVQALLKAKADVDAADEDGYTALRWAAHKGYRTIIKSLVHLGASLTTSGPNSWTLLKWAAQEGHEDMIRFLIKKRVDLNSVDSGGYTALRWAVHYNCSMTAWLLIQARADVIS